MKQLIGAFLLIFVLLGPARAMQNRYSPLNKPAATGNVSVVKKLLAQDAPVNATDKTGKTALMEAANAGKLDVVKALLQAGADVNMQSDEGATALLYAAKAGHKQVVAALLKADDLDTSLADWAGNTPIWWAAANGHADIIKQIVQADEKSRFTSVKHANKFGVTPLMAAIYQEQPRNVVQTLIDSKGTFIYDLDEDGDNVIAWAARNGKLDYLKLLAENDFQLDIEDQDHITPLMAALENGHRDVADFLIKEGLEIKPKSPNAQAVFVTALRPPYNTVVLEALKDHVDLNKLDKTGTAPLIRAAQEGNVQLVEDLLFYGADPNVRSVERQTPLSVAITNKAPQEIITLLLDAGANPNAEVRESTLLMLANKKGNAEAARLLKQAGAIDRPQALSEELFQAVMDNHLPRVKELLSQGADPNSRANTERGATVFEVAKSFGDDEMRRTILQAGANPTIHLIGEDNPDIVKMLLEAGADVNYRDANGWTPLLKACAINRYQSARRATEVIKLLLEAGADARAKKEGFLSDAPHHVTRGYLSLSGIQHEVKEANASVQDRMKAAGFTFDTPLTLWAAYGTAEGAELLLNARAEVNAENIEGHTALYVALDHQNEAVEKVLREHGAKMHKPRFYKQ